MHKFIVTAAGLTALALAAWPLGVANAQRGGHPGGGGGGGGAHGGAPMGGGHFGGARPMGGGAHFGGARMGAPQMHFGGAHGGSPHVGGRSVLSRGAGSHFNTARTGHAPRVATHQHAGGSRNRAPNLTGRTATHTARGNHVPGTANPANSRGANRVAPTAALAQGHGAGNPRIFAAHRSFANAGALRPFLQQGWHPHHHLGWVGPLFWPYAYGDLFYDALWPYEYASYDPFWYYGYDDIYESMFSPYSYSDYVQGRRGSLRMQVLTRSVAQSCDEDAAEVTGWPIDQIKAAVQPNPQQAALLENLGNAVVQASEAIKSHCPAKVAFTPVERLAQMQDRLDGLVQAVAIVQPALARFYDSLSDEQKARFDDMGGPQGKPPSPDQQSAQNPQACRENILAFPADQIRQSLRPDDAQRAKLAALQDASAKAADVIKAACPTQIPGTPPGRFDAEGKLLQAMLQGVQTVRPPLEDFYNSLSDDQKAQFNRLGQQLYAQQSGQ